MDERNLKFERDWISNDWKSCRHSIPGFQINTETINLLSFFLLKSQGQFSINFKKSELNFDNILI